MVVPLATSCRYMVSKMPLQSEKGLDITPGNYTGVMKKPRIETYQKTKVKNGHEEVVDVNYLVVDVHTDDRESVLQLSWSARVTPQTDLGRFLERMGLLPPVGENFDESTLDGVRIQYVVKPDGRFVRIVPESVRPVE